MQIIEFNIRGISPLLMHSDQLANPLHPATKAHKELTSKRKKTDADHEDIAKSEWLASLYYDEEIGIHIPGQNLDATMVESAKLQKLGKHVKRAAMVVEDRIPLKFKGPKDPLALFEDKRFVDVRGVKVMAAKLMRCRPIFREWELTFNVQLDEEVMNESEIRKIVSDGGRFIGLCDYRPRFGKFEVL